MVGHWCTHIKKDAHLRSIYILHHFSLLRVGKGVRIVNPKSKSLLNDSCLGPQARKRSSIFIIIYLHGIACYLAGVVRNILAAITNQSNVSVFADIHAAFSRFLP